MIRRDVKRFSPTGEALDYDEYDEQDIDADVVEVRWSESGSVSTPRQRSTQERDAFLTALYSADRDADAAVLKDDLQVMKDARDAAATSRTEMDAPDGEGSLSRWNPVKEIADEAFPDPTVDEAAWRAEVEARIEDQAKLLNLTVKEVRRIYGDIRSVAAALVRKFRKDGDDR